MAMILQHRTIRPSDASTFCHHFAFFSSTFLQKQHKKPKIIFLLCNSKEENRTVNYNTKRIQRPPRAKRPPTTNRAGRLTRFRESCPTPPTCAAFPTSQPPPKFRKCSEDDTYYSSSTEHTRQYMPVNTQKLARLQASGI